MSRAKRPRLRAPPLWKHNFRTEPIGWWPLKSLSCQSSEGDGSHSLGRRQFVSFYCRSAVRDSVRGRGSLDNEIWTLSDWQLTGCFLISYLQNWSTCDWLTLNVLLSTSVQFFRLITIDCSWFLGHNVEHLILKSIVRELVCFCLT